MTLTITVVAGTRADIAALLRVASYRIQERSERNGRTVNTEIGGYRITFEREPTGEFDDDD